MTTNLSLVNQSDPKNSVYLMYHDDLEALKKNVDALFLIIMGTIVLFLQPGFAFFESGTVRTKNVTSVLFLSYMDNFVGCLAYFLSGFAFAFGDGNGFCGTQYFALVGLPDDKMANCYFQYSFAATAATVVTASVHERVSMTAFFASTILMAGFTYPIVSHWAWNSIGWLSQLGYHDFAGSSVVHATGGAAAMAAALVTGPRIGRFEKNGEVNQIQPHSIPQVTLGAFISLFGAIAFNGGSSLTITNPGDGAILAKVAVNTLICTSSAAVTALFYQRFLTASGRTMKSWNFSNMLAGSFGGMIVICSGCDRYPQWGSLVVGVLSYFSVLFGMQMMERFKIDDSTNSAAVQLGPGYLGVICSAIFCQDGIILSPSKASGLVLLMNTIGGAVIIAWSFMTTFTLFAILRYFNLHRVSPREEKLGLDLAIHNQSAYDSQDKLDRDDSVESMSMHIKYLDDGRSFPRVIHESLSDTGHRSTAKVQQQQSSAPYRMRRMISEPRILAW